MTDLTFLKQIAENAEAIGIFAGLSVLLIKKVRQAIAKAFKTVKYYAIAPVTLGENIKSLQTKVDNMAAEFKPNGGGSIKDMVVQIKTLATEANEIATLANKKTLQSLDESAMPRWECEPKEGLCIWTNTALQKLFGLTPAEMLGRGWLQALHPDDIDETWERFQKTLTNSIPYRSRYRVINKNTQKIFWCEAGGQALQDKNGKVLSIWGWTRQLSAEEAADEERIRG